MLPTATQRALAPDVQSQRPPPQAQTVLGELHERLQSHNGSLNAVEDRLVAFLERVFGATPLLNEAGTAIPDGVAAGIYDQLTNAGRTTDRIHDLLNRLETVG